MGLTVLDNQFRIKIASDDFFNALNKYSAKSKKEKVLYQIYKDNKLEYFYAGTDIYILKDLGFWFSRIEKDYRYIYVFGVNEPNHDDSNVPICTIDFSMTGTNQNTSAVFAQDKHGKVSVLYRVNQQDLTLKSFELEFRGAWIQAQEREKNSYFILMGELDDPNFSNTFKEFLIELKENRNDSKTKDTEGDQNPTENSFKSCLMCGKPFTFTKSNYDPIISDLGIENKGYCTDCLEKIAAAIAMKKINKKINVNVFNKHSLLERVDDPDVFKSYLDLLIGTGFLREINQDLLISNNNQNIDELLNKYHKKDVKAQVTTPESGKRCSKCGAVLSSINSYKSDSSSDGLSDKCKDCFRKVYAVKALNHLEKYVLPGVPFSKNDLLKQVDNKTKFLDYIWTLQEFDLLKSEGANDFYILNSEEDLIDFKNEFGDEIKDSKNVISKDTQLKDKKPLKKVVKKCEICGHTLPISKYYKSSITEDGFTDKCKDCSRKSYAAKALIELKNYVEPEVEFYKDDLLKQADNRTQLLDYFWTLQEFDFIEHNEKNNTYILKPETEINTFIQKYGEIKEPTPTPPKVEEKKKAVKKCEACRQTLPISNFYKSSESSDGYAENCKKCSDKITAANVLTEIKKYIGIGNPFSKKELSNQLGNPTKVNYFIWTLQEHNLISHDEKKDTYIVEDSPTYKDYESLLNQLTSSKTSPISADSGEDIIKKDLGKIISDKNIIYISETMNSSKVMVLRGVIPKNNLYPILDDLKDIIITNMTDMALNSVNNDLLKLIIELEIENESYGETLKLLEEKEWKNNIKGIE